MTEQDEEILIEVIPDAAVTPEQSYQLVVDAAAVGDRLDRWLSVQLPVHSRSRLAQLADEGRVLVDGVAARPSQRLRAGQTVTVTIPAPAPALPQPEDIPLSILYEDGDLLVVDKPAGLVVHPAAGVSSGTLVNALLHHVRDLGGIGGQLRPGIVHRLDRDTSGAMVVAKNEYALVRLQKAFHDRQVHKQYRALVHGHPVAAGTFDTPFGRHPVERVRMTGRLRPDDPQARRAVTQYTTIDMFPCGVAQVQVQLETGRTHQIRVHFAEAGHPLLGDTVYGGDKRDRKAAPLVRAAAALLGRQALHAHRLAFEHPRTGRAMDIEAPLPETFTAAMDMLRGG